MLRNPSGHAVSWAWMCHRGPLSLIGPPCLVSPYRYCVSTARAFSVPGREGGEGRTEGEDGPRRAEGKAEGKEGGERERERERANVGRARFLRSSVIDENVCFLLFRCICAVAAAVAARLCVRVCVFSGRPEGVFYWDATVNCQSGGGWCLHGCRASTAAH